MTQSSSPALAPEKAMPRSAIYHGHVWHQRHAPFRHSFRYRVFTLLLDLDDLPSLRQKTRLLSYNHPNVMSIHDRDHGLRRDGVSIRDWVLGVCRDRGVLLDGGKVFMLCFPRIFGYVFNPLTVYYCFGKDGDLQAILYEVKNTFGEQHGYFIPVFGEGGLYRHEHTKDFHVSPFMGMEGLYRFGIKIPGEALSLVIRQYHRDEQVLTATWNGRRAPLAASSLAACLWRYPLLTVKVMAGIHWEALKIWLKGGRYHSKPPPPVADIS